MGEFRSRYGLARLGLMAAGCAIGLSGAQAQVADPSPVSTVAPVQPAAEVAQAAPATVAPVVATAAPCDCLLVPALMPIRLELVDPVSSKTSVTGANFAIRLAEAIVIEGVELVPAGTTGVGEVVHAKKSGGSGAGGELVIAARYLLLGETHIRLRSMRMSQTGKDQTVLALAASQAIGPFAFAIYGKNTEFVAGTVADAKIAEAIWLPRPTTVPAVEAVAACPVPATPPAEPHAAACPPIVTTPEGVSP